MSDRRWWRSFDSLRLRTAIVVLFGIAIVHFASLAIYQYSLEEELDLANQARLADQLLSIKRAVLRAPEAERETVAHDFSGGSIDAHWAPTAYATSQASGATQWQGLGDRLRELAPEIAQDGLVIGADLQSGGDPHLATVSMKLPDESWVNVNLVSWQRKLPPPRSLLVSTSLMAIAAIIASVLLVRWFTRPLTVVANAAQDLYRGRTIVPINETGPREVVELAAAFNDMQRRIGRLIDDRTQALAAVSHDLKTPITRLRFRAEDLSDAEVKAAMTADLVEMEHMIDQTLSFLRGDRSDEEIKPLDVVAILETLSDDASDLGAITTLGGASRAIVHGRRVALKRAFSNLVDNALKYGERAEIGVTDQEDRVIVTVRDRGPGIEEADIDRALSPFVRLEPSRNQKTGGYGLGLPIAKAIIEGHQGSMTFANHPDGGLVVTVVLPKQPST